MTAELNSVCIIEIHFLLFIYYITAILLFNIFETISRAYCIKLYKPGTHQADADELVATKADCRVGSPDSQVARPFYTGSPAEQPIRII